MKKTLPHRLLLVVLVLMSCVEVSFAAHQTNSFSPVLLNSRLPYRLAVQPYGFGAAQLPTLHSYAAGRADGKWVLIAGRTNGLHGFESVAANNFPAASQNREVWVIDPVARQSWRRSLEDPSSDLTPTEINSLTPTNNQFYQRGDRLYMTGGYGLQLELPNGSPLNGTFDTLSAIDLPGIAEWAMGGSGTARDHIRQISDSLFRVTGGAMHEIDGRTHLVFGQNFQGNYTPGTNGIYTNQVRSFDIFDDGTTLAIANPLSSTPNAAYRRRDLNVVPVIQPGTGGELNEELVALSGVFTTSNGVWTVPVRIDSQGNPTMSDPASSDTFKQGMNGYHSAKLGLYAETLGEMHVLTFGGISLQFLNTLTGQVETDNGMPFVNDFASIVIDSTGQFSQHRIGEFPVMTDVQGNRLRFGANAEFFPAEGIETFENGVIKLDALGQPTTLGYIFGGIAANGPHTRGVPGVTSVASNVIFEVTLIPVPEPSTLILVVGMLAATCAPYRRARRRQENTTGASSKIR